MVSPVTQEEVIEKQSQNVAGGDSGVAIRELNDGMNSVAPMPGQPITSSASQDIDNAFSNQLSDRKMWVGTQGFKSINELNTEIAHLEKVLATPIPENSGYLPQAIKRYREALVYQQFFEELLGRAGELSTTDSKLPSLDVLSSEEVRLKFGRIRDAMRRLSDEVAAKTGTSLAKRIAQEKMSAEGVYNPSSDPRSPKRAKTSPP